MNSVDRLVEKLEPLISDLDDDKEYLSKEKDELENVSRLLAYTKDDIDMVGIYADQELIIDNLSKINTDKDEYKASCYLLKSENENIKSLPQYKKAHDLISDIIEYFKLHKAELLVSIKNLEESCNKKEIEKKYYDILKEENPFIEDVDEFRELLDDHSVPDNDKIEILLYAINNNGIKYGIVNK